MILKLQTVVLSLSMLAANAKRKQVIHPYARKRREAKRVEQGFADQAYALLSNRLAALGKLFSGAATPSSLINAVRSSSVKATSMLPLTREKVELMAFTAEMTQAVYYQGTTACDATNDPEGPDCDPFNPGFEALGYNALYGAEIESGEAIFHVGADGVDANLFMDIGDYCFVAWRGTISFDITEAISIQDWVFRNFDIRTREAGPIGGGPTCRLHEGLYEAYQGGENDDNALEEDIIDFVESCMAKENKQLVLTGHSQGAGAAAVGALRFANYNPLAITHATPPILKGDEECPIINRDHVWRTVNTENNADNTEILYDVVPYGGLIEKQTIGRLGTNVAGEQLGAVIHLPPDSPIQQPSPPDYSLLPSPLNPSPNHLAYWGKDAADAEESYGPNIFDLSFGNDVGSSVHWVETGYLPKLEALLAGPFPIEVGGYVDGTLCSGDAECASQCTLGKCGGLLGNGESCSEGGDCRSGRCECEGVFCTATICMEGLGNGEGCNENSDCNSNSCEFRGGGCWFRWCCEGGRGEENEQYLGQELSEK